MNFKRIVFMVALLTLGCVYAMADENAALNGVYSMELRIGDRVFNDELVIDSLKRPIDLVFYAGEIGGTVTVPGVFSSPLTGQARCSVWGGGCELSFSIVAHENGGEFAVHYKAKIKGEDYLSALRGEIPKLTGDAYLDDDQYLGSFTALKK